MASILTARDLAKAYATHTLFTGVAMGLAGKDRLGLIGPNGSGKSTLLKILAGTDEPDAGAIDQMGSTLCYLAQTPSFDPSPPRSFERDPVRHQSPWKRSPSRIPDFALAAIEA